MIDQRALTIKLNHVILIEGFQKLSMSKLATAVDVSRATLYIYFKNKDEIVQAVVARHLQFITENPVPKQFETQNFLPIWLNSLLLMGSTTETFTTDLQHAYPELAHQLNMAYRDYFQQLRTYVVQGQQERVILPDYTPEFVIFQAEALLKTVLQQVRSHQLTLDQAERYIEDGLKFQLQGLLTDDARSQVDITTIEPFKTVIMAEFRATYALIP
ncbi:TetR/AcrR family transcriptional regulator [Lactiplantibacillus herbarum]|uniref:TetR/AcrR family transcriptional regulator n=1 Tax=Lactiplantibacillus herbarum TaxID=1670446 RepID=UPI00064F14E3|nr:TetR/AcrR family transcriptional regulator [Lactiplantibacillus herbarum]